jgi:hypothetical protein
MYITTLNCKKATRQFLAAMRAKANNQLRPQGLAAAPNTAVLAQADLDRQTVLNLLRD